MTKFAPIALLAATAALLPMHGAHAMPSLDRDAPAPKLAMAMNSSPKARAILGGQASSLDSVLSAQNAAAPTATAFAPIAPAATGTRRYMRAHRAALPAHASLPNFFGTVALSVTRTPFDYSWQRVANASVAGRSAAFAQRVAYLDEDSAIDAVNRYVNGRIAYVSDNRQFGQNDRWMRPVEAFDAGRGDCEDYAIAKMAMLKAAGFDADDLYLVVLKDDANFNDHAVLVVRSKGRFLVLDNSHDRVVDANDISFFRPIMTFSAAGSWIHGYDRAAPQYAQADAPAPVQLAANSVAPSSIFAR